MHTAIRIIGKTAKVTILSFAVLVILATGVMIAGGAMGGHGNSFGGSYETLKVR